ncbi:MAG: glycosyltransferase family 2 protein [Lachnospiraceae bacterium]|nr:glycosyltransferase family 2 protein [Lachnospiraceae bacterium]
MISVIIPTYNRNKTIHRAIDSVINQTYQDLELIVVDDGSTDDTEQTVASYQKEDFRIRYYRQENKGAAAARNTGISLAKGDYIAFQDSDDEWMLNKLEVQMAGMQEHHADISTCMLCRYSDDGHSELFPKLRQSAILPYETIISDGIVWTQMILAKKEVFQDCLFDETLRIDEDYEWAVRAAKDHTLWFEHQVLVRSFVQADSISRGSLLSIKTRDYFMEKHADLCEKYPGFYIYQLRTAGSQKAMLGMDDSEEYRKICEIRGSLPDHLKLLASKLRLRQLYYKWRR